MPTSPTRVVGVDWAAKQWACVELTDGAVTNVLGLKSFAQVVERFDGAAAIGVDIPIGLPVDGPRRRADLEARSMAGPSTVFVTYPQAVYDCPTHGDAVAMCRDKNWPGISRQSYGLRTHIQDEEQERTGSARGDPSIRRRVPDPGGSWGPTDR